MIDREILGAFSNIFEGSDVRDTADTIGRALLHILPPDTGFFVVISTTRSGPYQGLKIAMACNMEPPATLAYLQGLQGFVEHEIERLGCAGHA
jgi:hypothetical protein